MRRYREQTPERQRELVELMDEAICRENFCPGIPAKVLRRGLGNGPEGCQDIRETWGSIGCFPRFYFDIRLAKELTVRPA